MAEQNRDMGCGGLVLVLLGAALVTGGWLSINGMIFLDRIMFSSPSLSPLVSWTVAGSMIGVTAAAGRIARGSGRLAVANLAAALFMVLLAGVAACNWNRTEGYMPAGQLVIKSKDKPPPVKNEKNGTPSSGRDSLIGSGAVVISETANVREEPTTGSTAEFSLERGDRVDVVSGSGDWYRVRFRHEGKEISGWVHRRLLAKGE